MYNVYSRHIAVLRQQENIKTLHFQARQRTRLTLCATVSLEAPSQWELPTQWAVPYPVKQTAVSTSTLDLRLELQAPRWVLLGYQFSNYSGFLSTFGFFRLFLPTFLHFRLLAYFLGFHSFRFQIIYLTSICNQHVDPVSHTNIKSFRLRLATCSFTNIIIFVEMQSSPSYLSFANSIQRQFFMKKFKNPRLHRFIHSNN